VPTISDAATVPTNACHSANQKTQIPNRNFMAYSLFSLRFGFSLLFIRITVTIGLPSLSDSSCTVTMTRWVGFRRLSIAIRSALIAYFSVSVSLRLGIGN
jgi:hypothetical protein